MSDQEPNEGVGSLFFELAGDLRLLMLTKLNQKNYRLSQLATELNATMQEAHRNMTRLIEAGFIVTRNFSLTIVLAICRPSLSREWERFRAAK
jgi:predicted ArsR family transcriptional regulator